MRIKSRRKAPFRVRRRAVMLILVLAYLGLVGTFVVISSAGLMGFARISHEEKAAIALRQLIDSGKSWADMHQAMWPESGPISLDASSMLPENVSGAITLTRTKGTAETSDHLLVEVSLIFNGRPYSRTAEFDLTPWE